MSLRNSSTPMPLEHETETMAPAFSQTSTARFDWCDALDKLWTQEANDSDFFGKRKAWEARIGPVSFAVDDVHEMQSAERTLALEEERLFALRDHYLVACARRGGYGQGDCAGLSNAQRGLYEVTARDEHYVSIHCWVRSVAFQIPTRAGYAVNIAPMHAARIGTLFSGFVACSPAGLSVLPGARFHDPSVAATLRATLQALAAHEPHALFDGVLRVRARCDWFPKLEPSQLYDQQGLLEQDVRRATWHRDKSHGEKGTATNDREKRS